MNEVMMPLVVILPYAKSTDLDIARCYGQVRETPGPQGEGHESHAERERQHAIERLQDLSRRLKLMMAVIHVCFAALRHQNADSDSEIADVLQRHVGDRLSVEIEQLAGLVRRLSRVSRPPLSSEPDDSQSAPRP